MSETPGLASSSVDGDANIHDVADIAEKVIEVLVRHLVGHVADEERLGRRLFAEVPLAIPGAAPLLNTVELNDEIPTLEDLQVKVLDSGLRVVYILKVDVTESSTQASVVIDDLDLVNFAEPGENSLELFCGDLIEEVANVDRAVRYGGRIRWGASLRWLITRCCSKRINRLSIGGFLCWRQVLLHRRLSRRLRKGFRFCSLVADKSPLEAWCYPSLLL